MRQVTKRGPQFPSTPEVSKECQDLIVKMLVKISKRLTVPEIKSHVWFIKLAPSPREQAQALSPDDPKKVMSNNKVIKTTSTGAKVNKSRTGRRPSGSAPKMSNSKEKSADSEKKSSSYGQKINSRCDLNGSVRGRVSSSRKRFWTLPNLYSEVSETKILLFSYWFFMQIGWRETLDTSEP